MSIAPDTHSPLDLASLETAEIVKIALGKWEDLTGIRTDETSFRMRDLDVRDMNKIMVEALKLDPQGTTTYLLLECFLRRYLEEKTFTAASIMKDYAATTAYLKQAEELFSIVQSDRAVELASHFRNRVLAGVRHYKADRPDVIETIESPDDLSFLRRDALYSMENLTAYQFLAGKAEVGHAKVIEHVYMAWNINDLLTSVRDMRMSGIAVVLLRDPAHPDRSYFCFAMRNGENVILFTDKSRPAFPGQENVLSGRGGRGAARRFMSRSWQNHFPYQLVKTSLDAEGHLQFDAETAPVMAGRNLVPLMRISDLPDHQVIWLSMMLSLVAERFWAQEWRAQALSYTGAMIREKDLILRDGTGNALEIARNYTPIGLEEVRLDDLTGAALDEQVRECYRGQRNNEWLETRYRDRVPSHVINLWQSGNDLLLLPRRKKDDYSFRSSPPADADGICRIAEGQNLPEHMRPSGHRLLSFSPTEFGTEAEIRKDRIWIARHNMAQYIQKCAEEEYEERKASVRSWYVAQIERNRDDLLRRVALEIGGGKPEDGAVAPIVRDVKSSDWSYANWPQNVIGGGAKTEKNGCLLTGAKPSLRAQFRPRCAKHLAILAGCVVDALPDVLQHWLREPDYHGNHLLNRLDPMNYVVRNPWSRLELTVDLFLSKRGAAEIRKRFTTA